MRGPKPGTQPIRRFPYYKLQCFDDRVVAWMDLQIRFESCDRSLNHALSTFGDKVRIRVMMVEGEKSSRILESCGTVADSRLTIDNK